MTELTSNGSPLTALPPEVVTLIPYPEARRLKVAAISASDTDVTILIPDPRDTAAIDTIAELTSLSVTPIETSSNAIEGVLDRLSGSIDDHELWLQRRHIQALSRLVDHSVNLRKTERVRALVDRALEFAPYSAELWLMKARIAGQRREVIQALRIASQIAPDDRRILRWIQSFDEVAQRDEPTPPPPPTQEVQAEAVAPAETAKPTSSEVAPALSPDPMAEAAMLATAPLSAPILVEPNETVTVVETVVEPAVEEPDHVGEAVEGRFEDAEAGEPRLEEVDQAPEAVEAVEEAVPQEPAIVNVAPPATESLAAAVDLARIRQMPELLERLSNEMQRLTSADSVSTFFRLRNTWAGFSTDEALRSQLVKALPKENRLAAQVLKLGVPVVITDAALREEDVGPTVLDAGIHSFALLPIRTDGEVGGLLYLNYSAPDRANIVFESELGRTIELMLTCGGLSAAAIGQKSALEDAAAFDPLTGAYTVRQLEQLLETEIDRGRRYRYSVALLCFDVDNFAEVNAKFGRAAGDAVLQCVAKRVLEMGRSSDVLARRGSDDFMLMLPQTTGKGAEAMARRIHQAFENPITTGEYRVRVTVSIGMASFPERADDAGELMNAGEIALYSAKAQGKNRTSVADTLSLGS